MSLLKLVLRIMTRRLIKSTVVLLVSLIIVLFINIYADAISQHLDTLDQLYAGIEVIGYITNSDGWANDLQINEGLIKGLEESEFISKGFYTRNLRYMMEPWPDGNTWQLSNMLSNSPLTGANDIAAIPEFSQQLAARIEYLEGYDETLFTTAFKVCIVSSVFLAQYGYEVGDDVQFTVVENTFRRNDIRHGKATLQIVGVYQSNTDRSPVFCPWDTITDICAELDIPPAWNSARYVLQNTRHLTRFKLLLRSLGFVDHQADSKPSSGQLGFVINDRILNNATASVKNYTDFITALYPVIYLLCAGLGFIVSYLLIRIRKPEFAIMRSLGTSRSRAFLVFFLEQALLSILGAGFGLFLTMAISKSLTGLQVYSIIGFLAFYLVGTSVAILTLNRGSVIQILTAKE